MGLVPGGLLPDLITILAPTRVSNSAGGWTNTWAARGTARGALHAVRAVDAEKLAGAQPSDARLVQMWLDTRETSPNPKERLQTADGSIYEIIRITGQQGLAMVFGRQVS